MSSTGFTIDNNEEFENLPHAPIVEAVIHWRAPPGKKLEPEPLLLELIQRLPNYPNPQRQHVLGVDAGFGPERESLQQSRSWHGFRFETKDKRHVAQFTRNGFVFSRLRPYENWEQFASEAQRLWRVYRDLLEPSEVERLGVRFINQITPVRLDKLGRLLALPPRSPPSMRLPLKTFMHQNRFEIPNYPYNLNVIQTIQPPGPPQSESFRLILDLDVFTTQPIAIDDQGLQQHLREMRWIKNKAFFTYVKPKAIARFRE